MEGFGSTVHLHSFRPADSFHAKLKHDPVASAVLPRRTGNQSWFNLVPCGTVLPSTWFHGSHASTIPSVTIPDCSPWTHLGAGEKYDLDGEAFYRLHDGKSMDGSKLAILVFYPPTGGILEFIVRSSSSTKAYSPTKLSLSTVKLEVFSLVYLDRGVIGVHGEIQETELHR